MASHSLTAVFLFFSSSRISYSLLHGLAHSSLRHAATILDIILTLFDSFLVLSFVQFSDISLQRLVPLPIFRRVSTSFSTRKRLAVGEQFTSQLHSDAARTFTTPSQNLQFTSTIRCKSWPPVCLRLHFLNLTLKSCPIHQKQKHAPVYAPSISTHTMHLRFPPS